MRIDGSRVGVIGGSIAGCATSIALTRAGCTVEVYERSEGELQDRGSGIAIPMALREELIETGYLPKNYPWCRIEGRWWILPDGSPRGRVLWDQPGQAVHNNWGVLWRAVRAGVDDDRYHPGMTMSSFVEHADGVVVTFDDGTLERFDVLIGADGYRSKVRPHLHPSSAPTYAGYILWRGNYPECRVADRTYLEELHAQRRWPSVVFDGGHAVLYMIPEFDGGTEPPNRRLNWAIYTPQPDGFDVTQPTSIAPGDVSDELYGHLDRLLTTFPAEIQALYRLTTKDEVSIQPIYDELIDSYALGRVMVVGDAGTVTRPHTGSGATKALQDALAIERIATEADSWDEVLRTYDRERVDLGVSIVELGRRIGRAQVEETPNWPAMKPADFEAWVADTLAGETLYHWGSDDDG